MSRLFRIIRGGLFPLWLAWLVPAICLAAGREGLLSIAFGGDVMLDRGVRQTIERKGIGALWGDVAGIFAQADFAVINLECPVTDTAHPRDKEFVFRGEPGWLPALQRAGVTHAGLANNHAEDQGAEGLAATIRHLGENRIVPLGAGSGSAEACRPAVVSRAGVECALFSTVLVGLEGEESGSGQASPCRATMDELVAGVGTHRAAHPETRIIAFLHWGMEYHPVPAAEQRQGAHRLIDAGADAVIGHHPHVVQAVEEYQGKPIFYSLGNLVFDQPQPWCRESIVVILHLGSEGIEAVDLFPVRLADNIPRWVDDAGSGALESAFPLLCNYRHFPVGFYVSGAIGPGSESPASFDYYLQYKGDSTSLRALVRR